MYWLRLVACWLLVALAFGDAMFAVLAAYHLLAGLAITGAVLTMVLMVAAILVDPRPRNLPGPANQDGPERAQSGAARRAGELHYELWNDFDKEPTEWDG